MSLYKSRKGYIVEYKEGKQQYLHRIITDAPTGMVVDHINGDKTDNHPENLRVVTNQQNVQNRQQLNKNNTTGYRGVTLSKQTGKYRVVVRLDRVPYYFGEYVTAAEAGEVARQARIRLFGTFAGAV